VQGWCVVMTKPNCEAIAVENLLQQGYGCYYPRFKAIGRGNIVLKKPLFPRYVFASIDKFWYSIRGTRGVSHLLMSDGGPAIIPASAIEAMRSKEDDEGFIVLGKKSSPERFAKGDPVKATEGPLTGIDLIYDGMSSHERVKVLASLLGRQVPVIIEERVLVPRGINV
jgi:transcriptional antiterminator RfaH